MSFAMPKKQHFNPNPPVSRDALHKYLWEKANPVSRRLPVHQGELAEALQVTRGTIVRVMREMVEAGRIRKVDSKEANVRVYQVVDPEVWAGVKKEEPRRIRWG